MLVQRSRNASRIRANARNELGADLKERSEFRPERKRSFRLATGSTFSYRILIFVINIPC